MLDLQQAQPSSDCGKSNFLYSECTRSIQCLFIPGSRLQRTSVCTTLGIQQAQPSSDCGKRNFSTVDGQALSSVYSALVNCKISAFVQSWVYNKPNLLPTGEKVIFRQWMYKVYPVSIPPRFSTAKYQRLYNLGCTTGPTFFR